MSALIASLKKRQHALSSSQEQLALLSGVLGQKRLPTFSESIRKAGMASISPDELEILQVNVGKMCNQTCRHCHVDAGPDRKEIMQKETMRACLRALETSSLSKVDLTGGAPEMNPHFRWFVEEVRARDAHVMVRCNLTIILANPKYHDLPDFYRKHRVEVICSLPHFSMRRTDAQRGDGVFESSIKALQMLNALGYGKAEHLPLHLVYNPSGAFMPAAQEMLEKEFKQQLQDRFGIVFNSLYVITNMPISRFLDYLQRSGNLEEYMEKLVQAFNPATLSSLMCRNTLSVGWDGQVYDCDFNQMLDMPCQGIGHIQDFDRKKLAERTICTGGHCYGCTAGAGSSCGGEIEGS